jgi:exopolysaccharide biosynthesis polyprenyl glycosylphosphotransferase
METLKKQIEVTGLTLPDRDFAATRPPQHQVVRFLILADILVVSVAAAAAALLSATTEAPEELAVWIASTVAATLVAFSFYRLYERDRGQIVVSTLDEWRDFLNALSVVCFVEITIGHALHFRSLSPVSVGTIALFWGGALLVLPLARATLRHLVFPSFNTQQNTLIVGAGQVGQMIALKLLKHSEYNLRLVGFLDDEPHELESALEDVPVLGGEDDLVATIRQHHVSRVVLAFSRRPVAQLLDLIRSAGLQDIHLSIVPRYFEIMAANVGIVDVEGIPVVEVPAARLSRTSRATKRGLDLALTIPGLLVLAPVFLIVSLAIKLDSNGPVFFRQPRMGRNQRVFEIVKFRTMCVGAENLRGGLLPSNESTGPLFKIREDPRVTRVGGWLRRLSFDELPQLLNVVKGEMSLVGPRPFVVHEDAKIAGWARRRLDLTPGMTGLWQVLGRNDIGFQEMVKLDYLYVNNWSLWWDIKLLLRTAPIVFNRRGY